MKKDEEEEEEEEEEEVRKDPEKYLTDRPSHI